MDRKTLAILSLSALIGAASCSTTRVLGEGEYRLTKNEIEISGSDDLPTSELQTYVKQKPRSWSPLMSIYNWSGKDENSLLRKIGTPPTVYDPDLVGVSMDNIRRHLDYIGWYGSYVDTTTSVSGKKIKVSYLVTLGKRYPISSLTYVVPEDGEFTQDFWADTVNVSVKPGMYLSESDLEAETVRGASHFREIGYYAFNKSYYSFEADTLTDPSKAALKMYVNEYSRNADPSTGVPHRKYTFGNVDIYHPKTFAFREKVLRNLNTIHPGDTYCESTVNNTYSRLSGIRVIKGVNMEMIPDDSLHRVDTRVELTPASLMGARGNFEFSVNSSGLFGITPEVSVYHKNIFQGGEWLNVGVRGNFQRKPGTEQKSTEFGVSASLSIPRFLFLPYRLFEASLPRTDITLAYNYQNRPEYRRSILSTSYGYTGVHKKKLYYRVYPLQLNLVKLYSMADFFREYLGMNPMLNSAYRSHFDLGLGGTLLYTTDASPAPQGSYHYARLTVATAGNLLSLMNPILKDDNGTRTIFGLPYSQYVKGEIQLGKTWRFGNDDTQALATRFLIGAGYAYGNSQIMPFEQQFYSGGASSLRGWRARSVGPGLSKMDSTFVIPAQTGDFKLEANAEWRFRLFWKLDGALFVDAGNVWTFKARTADDDQSGLLRGSTFLESIAADWGLGLRLDFKMILVRIDTGFVTHDPSRDDGQRWVGPDGWFKKGGFALHFGVGYPF